VSEEKSNVHHNIITIDGPSASGKSSVSRELARKLGWSWISTGAFYRTLGHIAHIKNIPQDNEEALVKALKETDWEVRPEHVQTNVYIDGEICNLEDIYSVENGTRASNVSKFQKVRDAVLQAQRDAYKLPGLIAEGRDCGSVIFPDAPLKVFLNASESARSGRRSKETGVDSNEVSEALKIRDKQDSSRKAAPLSVPKGSWELDSSDLSLEEVAEKVYQKAKDTF